MIFWTFKITIISIILIFLIHHLVNFFTATLTVPKLKDLVNKPTEKYESIFNIISNSNNANSYSNPNSYSNSNTNSYSKNNPNYTTSELLPISENTTMKNELKDFLKKQLTTTNHTMNKNNQPSMNNINNPNTNANTNANNYSPLYSTNDNSYSLFH